MKSALDVHRALLAADVPHEIVRLRSRVVSSDDLPRVLQLRTGCVTVRCYVVQREGATAFVAVLVPAGLVPSPLTLLDALGAGSIRPARTEQVNARTDYAAGLVGPVCLPPDVELLADAALGASDVCYCAVGEGSVALGIRTRDMLVVTGARVAGLTGPSAGGVADEVPFDPYDEPLRDVPAPRSGPRPGTRSTG